MCDKLAEAVSAIRQVVSELDPGCLTGEDAARAVELFAVGERLCGAGKALSARRVEETSQWRRGGHRSPAAWMAATSGSSLGQAMDTLETARRIEDPSATEAAFRSGRLSQLQADEVTALEPWPSGLHPDPGAGRAEPAEAYAADALVVLARGDEHGAGSRPAATVQVRVDHDALVRGHTLAREICEVLGVGPVPVATARALASDAVVKAVVTDGVDVHRVAHLGCTVPAHLRTALDTRDPECVVPGCVTTRGLEIDHLVPWALGGPPRSRTWLGSVTSTTPRRPTGAGSSAAVPGTGPGPDPRSDATTRKTGLRP